MLAEQIELSMTIDTTLAVGRYEVQCVVGLEEPAREILAYRKHAVDFVVFGLQSFDGIAALEFEAAARRQPVTARGAPPSEGSGPEGDGSASPERGTARQL